MIVEKVFKSKCRGIFMMEFCLFYLLWSGAWIYSDHGLFWIFVWTFKLVCAHRFHYDYIIHQHVFIPSSTHSAANSEACRDLNASLPKDHSYPFFSDAGIETKFEGNTCLKHCFPLYQETVVIETFFTDELCLHFVIWNPSCRVGEATNPGPAEQLVQSQDILNIGALNTTGIYDKHDQICSLGKGIWSICETHATVKTQKLFSQKTKHVFNCAYTKPVKSIGTASGYRGIASGVACVTSFPIRTVHTGIPETVHQACRLLVNHITISSSTTLLMVSVYGPATGIATIADPQQLFDDLLNTATTVASQWKGPAILLGDFNTDPDQFSPIQALTRNGWIDAQYESHRRHGHPLSPTCVLAHGTSRHTRIYINPQCARSFLKCDIWSDHLFASHPALVLQCRIPCLVQRRTSWKLPSTFDAFGFDSRAAEQYEEQSIPLQDTLRECVDKGDLNQASKIWATLSEQTLAFSARNQQGQPAKIPKSHYGRAKGPKLITTDPSLPTVRDGRDDDFNPGWGQCNIYLRQVCKQARRIANLIHLTQARIRNPTAANEVTCLQLWQSIRNAPGFGKPFPQWFVEFAHESFPMTLPEIESMKRIQTIFQGHCDAVGNAHRTQVKEQTTAFFNDDWTKGGAKTFAQIKEDPLPNLPFVVHTIKSKVKKVAWKKQKKEAPTN